MNAVQEFCPWCQMYHTRSNLYITAGILGTTDMIMIFWRAVIAIKDHHSDIMRVSAKILHIAEVAASDRLPSLTLFPLHHVERIGHGGQVDWSTPPD